MISDRSYMRDGYGRQTTSALTWLICALIAGFVVQGIFGTWDIVKPGAIEKVAELSVQNLSAGRVWTLVTYAFLHGGFLHLAMNCLLIFFVGREIQTLVGDKRLVWLAMAAAVMGGIVWAVTNYTHGGSVIGASAIAMAYLVVFACLFPHRQITFLLFFVVPVTIKPIWAVSIIAAMEVLGFLFLEVPGNFTSPVAYSAHIGGMATGWLYYRFIHQREWRNPDGRADIELPKWFKKSRQAPEAAPAYKVNVTSKEDLKAAVDRVLDKINSEGFGALTDDEKRLLDRAKDSISRR